MNKQRHLIKKQIIELNFSSQQRAFELQNEVSRIYRGKIIPLIDDLLSQFSDSDTIYRINSLEINLGNIDINNLEQELIDQFIENLKQQLAEHISLSRSSSSADPKPNLDLNGSSSQFRTTEVLSDKNLDEKVVINTEKNQMTSFPTTQTEIPSNQNIISEIASKKGSQLEIFSYFLKTGMLPWWSEKLSQQQLEEYCDRLIETSPNQIKRLVENSIKDERQLRRIIFQFSEPTLLKIAELMADNLSAFLSDYLIVINKTLKGSDLMATRIPENRLKWELWRGILLSLYEKGNHPPDPSQLIAENLLYLATRLPCVYPRLLRQAIEMIASLQTEGQSFPSSLPEELVKLSDRHPTQLQSPNHSETSSQQLIPDVISPLNNSEEFPTPSDRHLHQSDLQNLPEIPSRQWEAFSDAIAPFSDSEEIYIDNAGLILLWPFLNSFFSQLKLVEKNSFVNDEAAERAALLLQYLVDASVDPPEHLLPLNKILCDIELLDPLDTHLDITEVEHSECENLLSAVIQNWSILKNTSIPGFRQAFLQRNGILKVRNGEWLLQIERETYDILLDRIPWSIRVVKLPWMDNILYIEW